MMELINNKTYKIFLKNGYKYTGKVISQKDKLIDFYDFKFKDSVMISLEAILFIEPCKNEADLNDFAN
jgi:hypothetical protein